MLGLGMTKEQEFQKQSWSGFIAIGGVIVILYLFSAQLFNWSGPGDFFSWWDDSTTTLVVMIIVFAIIVRFVTGPGTPTSSSGESS